MRECEPDRSPLRPVPALRVPWDCRYSLDRSPPLASPSIGGLPRCLWFRFLYGTKHKCFNLFKNFGYGCPSRYDHPIRVLGQNVGPRQWSSIRLLHGKRNATGKQRFCDASRKRNLLGTGTGFQKIGAAFQGGHKTKFGLLGTLGEGTLVGRHERSIWGDHRSL
jgi:hypothetical protein